MLTGWKKLSKGQRDHCRNGEASMLYDSQAVANFRWQTIARCDSIIKRGSIYDPCWTCSTIAKTLGYEYMLDVWRDYAGWDALDEPVDILWHYQSARTLR